ncbi:MAG: glutamate 5-kinase [Rhodospirillales bacterium]|nr:glutamate 5-kinase [Rhodospirillales bacterium]MDH3790307.1 glutamate 5-kinase [Rhodospirillales bacterium]MDH3909985.1 glutamate 5-kinase [Rhodospirillales bacterium]
MSAAVRPTLADAKRLVVKIGSALLVDETSGALKQDWLNALADDLAVQKDRGAEVIVVSSGSIALGRRHLGLTRKAVRLEEQQAAAATGQIRLAHAYQSALGRHDITVAQILLTLADTEQRRRHLNARNTLNTLLRLGAVPVINENDTVATTEIRFGDNDRLAARVAAMMNADALVLLSDIDGLYSADPKLDPSARFIPLVATITGQIEAMAGRAPVGYSSGGMVTKLQAARIAVAGGCRMVIADGRRKHPLAALADGARCTWFLAEVEPLTARKRWIAGSLKPTGRLVVDAGALRALQSGRSLLPAGVTAVEGLFERGDAVVVLGTDGVEVARGLCAYSAQEARLILGHKSSEIEARLGYRGREELIHRDDLVLM